MALEKQTSEQCFEAELTPKESVNENDLNIEEEIQKVGNESGNNAYDSSNNNQSAEEDVNDSTTEEGEHLQNADNELTINANSSSNLLKKSCL